jgi:hypothetical protein
MLIHEPPGFGYRSGEVFCADFVQIGEGALEDVVLVLQFHVIIYFGLVINGGGPAAEFIFLWALGIFVITRLIGINIEVIINLLHLIIE